MLSACKKLQLSQEPAPKKGRESTATHNFCKSNGSECRVVQIVHEVLLVHDCKNNCMSKIKFKSHTTNSTTELFYLCPSNEIVDVFWLEITTFLFQKFRNKSERLLFGKLQS